MRSVSVSSSMKSGVAWDTGGWLCGGRVGTTWISTSCDLGRDGSFPEEDCRLTIDCWTSCLQTSPSSRETRSRSWSDWSDVGEVLMLDERDVTCSLSWLSWFVSELEVSLWVFKAVVRFSMVWLSVGVDDCSELVVSKPQRCFISESRDFREWSLRRRCWRLWSNWLRVSILLENSAKSMPLRSLTH